jgi:hypothetical protein
MQNRLLVSSFVGVLATMGIACAHAPAASEMKAPRVEKIFVTGSHIPQRIDLASSALPTISPLRVYGRQQMGDTGRGYDLRAALSVLDLSVAH